MNFSLKQTYSEFMQEYYLHDHMEPVIDDTVSTPNQFYLPHHASSIGLSLSDLLLVGLTIQQDLFSIMALAMTANIAMVHRQIVIVPTQADLQRISWHDDLNSEIQIYKFKTVTYGTFLALRTLYQLASVEEHDFSKAAMILRREF
ncbi:hypothetical protein PR048_001335 [Dryococelus australis]|uniref:Uncharacterized protein n=1 Tax=Dryococelus australis TaxID=614101 RepID=A0ABQ9IH77_9NEOP|nr:hypothetical protein PR048_001335 [Dryococelus australis]